MQDFVPKEISDLIAAIEAKQDADFQERKRAEEAERARLAGIEELRERRAGQLKQACRTINDWLERFEKTAGPSVWRLHGHGIVIFSAKFWRGEPCPPNDRACSAQLRFGPPGDVTKRLVYEELHKGHASVSQPLLSAWTLQQSAHPDFVTQCAAHLESGEVWKTIRASLERIAPTPR
jgi:hypothetical protein